MPMLSWDMGTYGSAFAVHSRCPVDCPVPISAFVIRFARVQISVKFEGDNHSKDESVTFWAQLERRTRKHNMTGKSNRRQNGDATKRLTSQIP